MNPFKTLYQMKRPKNLSREDVPCLDFGVGLTPTKRDVTVQMLAIGWGKYLQLIYFCDETDELILDGLYVANSVIKSVHFSSDSVIAMVDHGTMKVLYCPKFLAGDLAAQASMRQEEELLELS
jgi:hypothetical protein